MGSNSVNLGDDSLRTKMKSYWKVYSPSLESMMLSHDAKYLAENEQNEILSYLPNYKDKKILELGAGIGRFTSKLALSASHVTAVDFMQAYVDQNEKDNGHLKNISFKCADITKIDFPPGSFDLVFTNWLFMYLSNDETKAVFKKILEWLTPGGYFFLRESCYHQSGNVKRDENPTIYRTPIDYCMTLEDTMTPDQSTFKIVRGKSILTYIQYHSNPNQLCFLARRTDNVTGCELTKVVRDRYSLDNIIMGERLFSHEWSSHGGYDMNREMCTRFQLLPKQQVLEVGCGAGASAFFMARHYGVHVHGIDLSPPMIHMAIERQGKLEHLVKKRIQFEIGDILDMDYDEDSFDAIYSRDSILHISDQKKLFKKFYKWLKPGGTLFFTNYCRGITPESTDFSRHTRDVRRYTLMTVASQVELLESLGFKDVQAEDMREKLVKLMQRELQSFVSGREAFVSDFCQSSYEHLVELWNSKIQWTKEGQMTWGLFLVTK